MKRLFFLLFGIVLSLAAAQGEGAESALDAHFLAVLRQAGVLDAAREMGLAAEQVFVPLAAGVGHPYRRYRWWLGQDGDKKPIIHALPPEEEMGWTPWERWSIEGGKPVHRSWVLYPVRTPTANGVPRWYALTDDDGVVPRFLRAADSLEKQLRRARVDTAARVLGLDFNATFLDPLTPSDRNTYAHFRWVVIPHTLADDQPVIYALPPMNRSAQQPWESWYTDGLRPRIHHVHFTSPTPRTTGQWRESPGAQQRPPEIMGPTWQWYDEPSMTPALANEKRCKGSRVTESDRRTTEEANKQG